jgi:hypothetical protein
MKAESRGKNLSSPVSGGAVAVQFREKEAGIGCLAASNDAETRGAIHVENEDTMAGGRDVSHWLDRKVI